MRHISELGETPETGRARVFHEGSHMVQYECLFARGEENGRPYAKRPIVSSFAQGVPVR